MGKLFVPADLASDIRTMLHDPITGRTRYGSIRGLTIALLQKWVEEHRTAFNTNLPGV